MKRIIKLYLLSIIVLASTNQAIAQYNPVLGCIESSNSTPSNPECAPNVILSAVPFLRVAPDARSGALGDSGLATSADPNALHFNSSKLAFIDKDMSFSATYTPWLRNLGLRDVYLAYLTGYKKVDELQTIGMGLRFFSLGNITFTDLNGNETGIGSPREFEFAVSYNRKLSDNFAAGLTAKYIHSNLASGQMVQGLLISSANAFAADLSLTYKKEGNLAANGSEWTFGAALTNLGSKVTYSQAQNKDFIPANIGLGAALMLNFDEYNSITINADINKLLLPTPVSPTLIVPNGSSTGIDTTEINPVYDANMNGFPDYKEQSIFSAALSSLGDAQGGFGEEIKEINYSLGLEYWYDKQFAARLGYYYEHPEKGDRQFITVGLGIKYNVFAIDLSYLVPTNNRRNPLDNTLRFTLQFDFEALTSDY